MAKIKFEIDTDDIFEERDYDGDIIDGNSFEDLVRSAIGKDLKEKFQKKFSGEAFDRVSKNIFLECAYQVDKKLRALVNEDIVIQDRWGKPKFLGTVEDYIKKTIDEKLLRPVNSNGKTLEGCSLGSDNETWIEWSVKDSIERRVDVTIKSYVNDAEYYAKKQIKQQVSEFKNKTLNKLITEKLQSVGAS